ncbi:hypothetical protein [Mumia sp. Pv 4-285]|uniref:hypothetical protein n=1 Tax=Mumia qirimensis TaxID=3234852 RepID=UPI00351CCCE2
MTITLGSEQRALLEAQHHVLTSAQARAVFGDAYVRSQVYGVTSRSSRYALQ